jgi:hypothetical protein
MRGHSRRARSTNWLGRLKTAGLIGVAQNRQSVPRCCTDPQNGWMVGEERIVEEELNLRVVFGAGLKQRMVQRKLVYRMVGGYLRGRRRQRRVAGMLVRIVVVEDPIPAWRRLGWIVDCLRGSGFQISCLFATMRLLARCEHGGGCHEECHFHGYRIQGVWCRNIRK